MANHLDSITDNPLVKFLASLLTCALSGLATTLCDPPINYPFAILMLASGALALYVLARLAHDY